MTFRKDVNGLRAIAVLAVLLFHFKPSWVPGGFAGVDVFFVISGYLMTGIIFRGIERGKFSVLTFYVARANRIIPALAALCLTLLIFGWFFLAPLDYQTLGRHAAGSVGFISNVLYWQESGYFDTASSEKWLLHTWSLSIEWQFYVLYPLALIAVRNLMSKESMKSFVVIGATLSFLLCVMVTYQWPSSAYYFLPTRAWELMVGGIAYLYPFTLKERPRKILELGGITLIVGTCFYVSAETPWPGYVALLPVLGSYFVLQAQQENSIATGNIIFQKIGAWSYSIYLWHWPLVVAIYYFSLSHDLTYIGIPLSILLGFISHRYIETIKFKEHFSSLSLYLTCRPVHLAITIGALSTLVAIGDGFGPKLSRELMKKNESAKTALGDWGYPEPNLEIGNSAIRFIQGNSDKNILFIGASHIEQTYPYVEALGSKYNVYYLTKGGCFVSPSYTNPKVRCSNIQDYKPLFDQVKFDRIVTSIFAIDANLPSNEETRRDQIRRRVSEYDDFLMFAKENANQVFMLLGAPKGDEFDPRRSIIKNLKNYVTTESVRKAYEIHYNLINDLSGTEGIMIIDPIKHLCSDGVCMTADEDFNFFYKDRSHMRPGYAKRSLQYLDVIFEE